MLAFIKPKLTLPDLDWGQTTKVGGVSGFGESKKDKIACQQNTLNLAPHVNDSPTALFENWRRFEQASLWSRQTLATCQQVHGTTVLEVTAGNHHPHAADAIISRTPGLAVGVFTADCVPILVVDPVLRHVAAIHCGWKGVAANLTAKTIKQFFKVEDYRQERLLIWIGASIRRESYEVGPEVAHRFDESMYQRGKLGKFQLDLAKAVRHQLLTVGIQQKNIEDCQIDSYTSNKTTFSYRADGKHTGRMLTYVGFLK